jgi:hypothetical protein
MWLVEDLLRCSFEEALEQLSLICENALRLTDRPGTS